MSSIAGRPAESSRPQLAGRTRFDGANTGGAMWYVHGLLGRTRVAFTLAMGAVASLPPAELIAQEQPPPFGWFANIEVPGQYSVGADVLRRLGGTGFVSGTIASLTEEPKQSAFMQQSIRADLYRGKRLRFTGYLKANIVAAQAGLFLRVDGRDYPAIADLMVGRLIQETKNWQQYSIVLDVPRDAVGITFGFHLTGAGQVWMDDGAFEIVDRDVATTVDAASQAEFGGWGLVSLSDGGSQQGRGFDLWKKYRSAVLRPINLTFEQLSSFGR
jgi:hypothetical protein